MDYFSSYAAFLDYRYWMNLRPIPLTSDMVSGILSFFLWFVIAYVILRLVARSLKKKQPRHAQLCRRIAGPMLSTGLLGLVFLFFTYEQVPVLGMRFWFLLIGLYFLVEVGRVAHYAVVDFPNLRHHDLERQRLEKYLPKKK